MKNRDIYGISCTDCPLFVPTCITKIAVSAHGAYIYVKERKPDV
jgi:hypothetical protein